MASIALNALRAGNQFGQEIQQQKRNQQLRNALAKGDLQGAIAANPEVGRQVAQEHRLGRAQNLKETEFATEQQRRQAMEASAMGWLVGNSIKSAETKAEKFAIAQRFRPVLEKLSGQSLEEMSIEDLEKEFQENELKLKAGTFADAPAGIREKILNPESDKKPNLQRVSAIVEGEDRPSTLLFNPEQGTFERTLEGGRRETIPSDRVTQVSVTGGQEDVMPVSKNRADDIRSQRDWLNYQVGDIDRMLGLVEEDPSLVGAPGAFRRIGQTVTGAAEDLSSMFRGEAQESAKNMITQAKAAARGDMPEDQYEEMFNDPALSELRLFENTLAYTIARLRKPDGRLPVAVINDAKEDAKLTGFTSSRDVQNRLKSIRNQIKSRMQSMEQRLGNDPSNAGQQTQSTPDVDWIIGEDGEPRPAR